MKLNTARVFVRDLGEAKRFYRDRLGLRLKIDGSGRGFCVFDAGPVELVVETVAGDAPEEEQVLVGRFTGLSFSVADVHVEHRALVSAGVVFTGEPELQAWGGVLATFQDPAGNEWQIVQHPT